jgi:hypothetical protein
MFTLKSGTMLMNAQVFDREFARKRSGALAGRGTRTFVLGLAVAALSLHAGTSLPAQTVAGPYERPNWGQYYWSPTYNPATGYAINGVPGIGVSPWNPIVQSQLNLGLRMARYNMYNSWADQSNAAANLYYQQAMAQAIQNAQQQQQLVPARYDVRTRQPGPAGNSESSAQKQLPRNKVLAEDGTVLWPESMPASEVLDRKRIAAQSAIRVAVKEFEQNGKATVQSVGEAKSELFAYGKPVLEQLVRANRDEAQKLLKFFASLEQVLNELAGE